MKYVIDRFEGEYAVIEVNNTTVDMPKILLPDNAKEGSIIEIRVLENESQTKKEEMQQRLNKLFNKQ